MKSDTNETELCHGGRPAVNGVCDTPGCICIGEEVRTCATCGNDAGEDWETADDEYQEIICQQCKAKKAEAKQNGEV